MLDMPSSLVYKYETKPQSDMSETDGVSLPQPSNTSALMSRLQAFLPQMKEANQGVFEVIVPYEPCRALFSFFRFLLV
jgi:hypothetical protein